MIIILSSIDFLYSSDLVTYISYWLELICCCSVAQLCPTLCNPMDCSTSGFPVLHYLLEFAQTHVCWVSDAIQPSHLLSPPSPPAVNLSQHQGLFQWVGFLHQVAKVLELQHHSFQWIFRVDFLWDWPVGSPCNPKNSQASWKHLFFSTQPSLWSKSHICTWLLGKPYFWLYRRFSAQWCLYFLICFLGLS